jgi:hypothetical protein
MYTSFRCPCLDCDRHTFDTVAYDLACLWRTSLQVPHTIIAALGCSQIYMTSTQLPCPPLQCTSLRPQSHTCPEWSRRGLQTLQGPARDDLTIPVRDRSCDRYRGAMIAAAILIGVSQTVDMGVGRVSSLSLGPPQEQPRLLHHLPSSHRRDQTKRLHVAG